MPICSFSVVKGMVKIMTRENMLSKLHRIKIGAQPTVLYTSGDGLQYEYVTAEGCGENLGNMGDWPVYKFCGITRKVFDEIRKKISSKTLTISDLEGTVLLPFYNEVFEIERPNEYQPDLSEYFGGLVEIETSDDGMFYALCDSCQWEPEAFFYETHEDLETAFLEQYAGYIRRWEELDDEELEEWVEKVDAGLVGIPFKVLHNNTKPIND